MNICKGGYVSFKNIVKHFCIFFLIENIYEYLCTWIQVSFISRLAAVECSRDSRIKGNPPNLCPCCGNETTFNLEMPEKKNNFVVCCCFIIKLSNPSTFAKYKKQKQLFCSFIIQMSSLYCLLFCNQNVHCPRRQLATLSLGREKERARSSVRMKNGLQ